MRQIALVIVLSLIAAPRVALAHHEAIFGPQSAAVLSAPRFISAQFFARRTGKSTSRRRQTTAVISGGLQPFRAPFSLSVVVPVSFIGNSPAGGGQKGLEDILLSGRYKVESARLTEALHLDESYVMGVGGLELPTGTIDHAFGKGAPGAIAAALVSVERRPVSGIGYAYYHHTGVYQGTRERREYLLGRRRGMDAAGQPANGTIVQPAGGCLSRANICAGSGRTPGPSIRRFRRVRPPGRDGWSQ